MNLLRRLAAMTPPRLQANLRPRRGLPAVFATLISILPLNAQQLEPRAYSVSPEGVNFIVLAFVRSTGDLSFDPTVPVEQASAQLNYLVFGYGRTINFLGRSANVSVALPYVWGPFQGVVNGNTLQTRRSGFGDPGFRLAVNLYGAPAMNAAQFKDYQQRTVIGASMECVAPMGQYSPSRLLNIGSNRWAVKPEIGISRRLGRWYLDTYFGVWLFTANDDFVRMVRKQDPLGTIQVHVSYNITRRIWAAFDANYYTGGRTIINGVRSADFQRNSRIGATVAIPVVKGQSVKFSYSTGARTNIGAAFTSIGVGYQVRWGGGL
jgi:hypothetical protein